MSPSTLPTAWLAILAGLQPGFVQADTAVQPPDGIVGWWPGDGNTAALVSAPVTLGGGAGFTGRNG